MSLAEPIAVQRLTTQPSAMVAGACASTARRANSRSTSLLVLDLAERVLALALYGWLVARILAAYWADGGLVNLLLLPSEGVVVVFLLIRRNAREVTRRPGDWLLAFGAAAVPLLVTPGIDSALLPPIVGASILLTGLVIQLWAKIVLGRSFGCVPANRGLKLAGPYRFVRHPMYAGYLLTHLAFLAMNPTAWNAAVYVVCYCLQIPRLLTEERLLGHDPHYADYQRRVNYRLIPGVF